MLQTQPLFDSIHDSLTFNLKLGTLRHLGRFLNGWIDRSADEVVNRAVFMDFPNKQMHVARITRNNTDTMGIMSFPFEYTDSDVMPPQFLQETEGLLLALPIHKVISVLSWMNSSTGQPVIGLTLSKEGKVTLEGNNNKIRVDYQWVKGSSDTLLANYQGSPLYGLQQVYDTLNSGRESSYADLRARASYAKITQLGPCDDEDPEYELTDELDRVRLFTSEMHVSKIDGNLVYMKDESIGGGAFRFLEFEEGKGVTEREASPSSSGVTLVGYSRMSLFFNPMDMVEMTSHHPICASDGSVPGSYLQEVHVLINTLVDCMPNPKQSSLNIMTTYLPGQHDDTFDCVGLHMQDTEDLDFKITVVLTIPSAGILGMAPPSAEDIQAIVPEISKDESFYVTVPYGELHDTLSFWDSLQKVDGNDIITPLRPVYLSVVDKKLQLTMHGMRGTNEATFDIIGDYYFDINTDVQVPFDPLMKVLNNPRFRSNSATQPYITLTRRAVDDPAEIIVSRNGCTAVIAEFV